MNIETEQKISYLVLILMVAVLIICFVLFGVAIAHGQTTTSTSTSTSPPWTNMPNMYWGVPYSPTLKCGKYQHVDHWYGSCGPIFCGDGTICAAPCTPVPPDKCVDDLHVTTEKEWQEIMKRLDKLEFKTSGKAQLDSLCVEHGNVIYDKHGSLIPSDVPCSKSK